MLVIKFYSLINESCHSSIKKVCFVFEHFCIYILWFIVLLIVTFFFCLCGIGVILYGKALLPWNFSCFVAPMFFISWRISFSSLCNCAIYLSFMSYFCDTFTIQLQGPLNMDLVIYLSQDGIRLIFDPVSQRLKVREMI